MNAIACSLRRVPFPCPANRNYTRNISVLTTKLSVKNSSTRISKQKFLHSVNYFRGVAIILIVLGHCFGLANWGFFDDWQQAGYGVQLLYSASVNSSVYFVFISGFLYYHIFYPKFSYGKFMRKKVQYVLLPYILISLIPIAYKVLSGVGDIHLSASINDNPFLLSVWFLFSGRTSIASWYIPMAMLLFAISPLINIIIKKRKSLAASLILLPVSLLIHRPIDNLNHIQSLIYFLPVYFLGIWSCQNHQKILKYLQNNQRKLWIAIFAITCILIQVFVFHHVGNFHKDFWSFTVVDVNLLQKIAICFLFLSWLDTYENTDIIPLKKTADTSFAVYFIHPYIILVLDKLSGMLNWNYSGSLLTLITATSVTLVASMGLALVIKKFLGKKSRYLIGW